MSGRTCEIGCECKRHTNSGHYERTDEHRRQVSERQRGRRADWVKPCVPGCDCGKHERSEEFRRRASVRQMGKRADGTPAVGSYTDAYGYRVLTGQWGHPLVLNNGEVKEHRSVLYEKIGPGPHPCHWCNRLVNWRSPTRADDLCVDHLDRDRLNNEPDNLAPSCFRCNWDRDNPRAATRAITLSPEIIT